MAGVGGGRTNRETDDRALAPHCGQFYRSRRHHTQPADLERADDDDDNDGLCCRVVSRPETLICDQDDVVDDM